MPVNIVEEEKKGTKSDFEIFPCGRLGERGECFSGGAREFTITTNSFGIACDLGHVAGTLVKGSRGNPIWKDCKYHMYGTAPDRYYLPGTTSRPRV